MASCDIYLNEFNNSITSIDPIIYNLPDLIYNEIAVYYLPTTYLRELFTTNSSRTKFYTTIDPVLHLNPGLATVETKGGNTLEYDFLSVVAANIFGTRKGVALFNNINDMLHDIYEKFETVWATQKVLLDESGTICEDSICEQVYNGMTRLAPHRSFCTTLAPGETDKYMLPFIDGDSLCYLVKMNMDNINIMPVRSSVEYTYLLKLVATSDINDLLYKNIQTIMVCDQIQHGLNLKYSTNAPIVESTVISGDILARPTSAQIIEFQNALKDLIPIVNTPVKMILNKLMFPEDELKMINFMEYEINDFTTTSTQNVADVIELVSKYWYYSLPFTNAEYMIKLVKDERQAMITDVEKFTLTDLRIFLNTIGNKLLNTLDFNVDLVTKQQIDNFIVTDVNNIFNRISWKVVFSSFKDIDVLFINNSTLKTELFGKRFLMKKWDVTNENKILYNKINTLTDTITPGLYDLYNKIKQIYPNLLKIRDDRIYTSQDFTYKSIEPDSYENLLAILNALG